MSLRRLFFRYYPRPTEIRWWHWILFRAVREYLRLAKLALPDGTRVRLICGPGCQFSRHDGVWRTSWTPRRNNQIDDPDDYLLEREGDREFSYACREVLQPLEDA